MSKTPNWQRSLLRWAHRSENTVDQLRHRFQQRFNSHHPIMIQAYLGFANDTKVLVRARVLADRGEASAKADDSAWQNFSRTMQRLRSREIPFAKVAVELQGRTITLEADEEGHIQAWLELSTPLDGTSNAIIQLPARLHSPSQQPEVSSHLPVYLPNPQADLALISDIDDTIVHSDATRAWSMLRELLFKNAHTRLPLAGVAQLYHALTHSEQGQRPIFYVSSSPWNLYPLLTTFMRINQIPLGPITLRDWGLNEQEFLPTSHSDYKLEAFRTILDSYPQLAVLLFGDSGQQDPEIYQQIVQEYPQRVRAIYIRALAHSQPARHESIGLIAEKVRSQGVAFQVVKDSLEVGKHALEQGWLSPAQLENIRQACAAQSSFV